MHLAKVVIIAKNVRLIIEPRARGFSIPESKLIVCKQAYLYTVKSVRNENTSRYLAHGGLPQSAVVASGCPAGYRCDRDHGFVQEVSLNQGWTEACKTCFARLPSADKP